MVEKRCGTCNSRKVDTYYKKAGYCFCEVPAWVDLENPGGCPPNMVSEDFGSDCPKWSPINTGEEDEDQKQGPEENS